MVDLRRLSLPLLGLSALMSSGRGGCRKRLGRADGVGSFDPGVM